MANHDFTTPEGARLRITTSDATVAMALVKALKKATYGLPQNADIETPVIISDEVEAALVRCFARVIYDDQRMELGLMDDPKIGDKVRRDYFFICSKVIEVNCEPFFAQTSSKSSRASGTKAGSPESGSKPTT